MLTFVTARTPPAVRARALWLSLRAAERVVIGFFLYLAALAWLRHLPLVPRILLLALPALIGAAAVAESLRSAGWSRVLRDWLTMGLILVAYWSIGWFAAPPLTEWQDAWVAWDRALLSAGGLRAAVETLGPVFPSLLESVYLLLYAFPPIAMCVLYATGGRSRVEIFLFTLMLGTLAAYALLPLFPVHGPRVAFAGLDLPNIDGLGRGWNIWLLDHADIPTSVFPSGHVAVAFATAFGMLRAMRHRPAIWAPFFVVASIVYVATIYGRYHYAVDGLASVAIAAIASKRIEKGDALA